MAALLRRSSRTLCQCQRNFSTSTSRTVSLQWDRNNVEALADTLPEYPYGPAQWYKQSNRGLYGGQRIQFGNNVSEKHQTKTRRTWQPNIFTRKLFSKALNRYVQVRVSSRVLRTIDKLGGLDEYLLGEKEARIKELGVSGWWLRWAIMQTPGVKKRFRQEREQLGLPADPALAETGDLSAVGAVKETQSEVEAEADAVAEAGAETETEQLAQDGAFQVEHNKDLPPLKFRVGPRQHVMLTENGWVRTRPGTHPLGPGSHRLVEKRREEITRTYYDKWFETRLGTFIERLEKQQEEASKDGKPLLSDAEKQKTIRAAKKEFRAELEANLDKQYKLLYVKHVNISKQKKAEKKNKEKRSSEEPSAESRTSDEASIASLL